MQCIKPIKTHADESEKDGRPVSSRGGSSPKIQLCDGLDPVTHRNEDQRAKSGGRVLGRGQRAPSASARCLGSAVSSPSDFGTSEITS